MPDTRRWPRIKLDLEVQMAFDDLEQMSLARTTDVSHDGLFVAMARPRPVGTKVRVKVQIRKPDTCFVLEGVVVRTVPDPDSNRPPLPHEVPGIGIFVTSSSAGWSRLCRELLEQRSARRSEAAASQEPLGQ